MKRVALGMLLLLALAACGSKGPQVAWKWNLQSRSYATPVVFGENVLIVSQAGEVICGNARSGKRIWAAKLSGEIVADPAISGNRVFAATTGGLIAALDGRSGNTIWQTHFSNDGFIAPLTARDDLLLAASQNGVLYAIRTNDGAQLWKVEGNRKYNAKPVIQDSRIYIGGWMRSFLCLNMDGSQAWKFSAGAIVTEECLILKNVVYFSDYNDTVYALDALTGRPLWKSTNRQPTRVNLFEKNLAVATDAEVRILRAEDGSIVSSTRAPSKVGSLSVSGNRLILVTRDGSVFDIHPQTSSLLRLNPASIPIFKAVLIDDLMLCTDTTYGVYGVLPSKN